MVSTEGQLLKKAAGLLLPHQLQGHFASADGIVLAQHVGIPDAELQHVRARVLHVQHEDLFLLHHRISTRLTPGFVGKDHLTHLKGVKVLLDITELRTHTGFALSLIALVRTFWDPPSSSCTSR